VGVKLFADDCKLYFAFKKGSNDTHILQEAINSLVKWTEISQLQIAFEKCAILHLGYGNHKVQYSFGNKVIPVVKSIRDLGVIVSDNMKFHEHIENITKAASRSAILIKKCFVYDNPKFLMKMFNVFVRPKIEYASQVWNPYLLMDIDMLENVQRRFTKYIPQMFNLSYPQRLHQLKLHSLELRRLHLDLTFAYKLIHGKMKVNFSSYFVFNKNQTRSNGLKLQKPWAAKCVRLNFFSHRIVRIWNSLPAEMVFSSNVSKFKK
jgi:hypothetical protein